VARLNAPTQQKGNAEAALDRMRKLKLTVNEKKARICKVRTSLGPTRTTVAGLTASSDVSVVIDDPRQKFILPSRRSPRPVRKLPNL
jgi:hypothetical protein